MSLASFRRRRIIDRMPRRQYRDLNQGIHLLQKWIDELPGDGKEMFFDCTEQVEDDEQQLMEMLPICSEPWISEIWLTVHRKTNLFRRFLNLFHRSKRSSLPDLADEYLRIYNGSFHYPIGFRFHISHAKEKWLLILKSITLLNYPMYPYPHTRIIFIYKNLSFIAR